MPGLLSGFPFSGANPLGSLLLTGLPPTNPYRFIPRVPDRVPVDELARAQIVVAVAHQDQAHLAVRVVAVLAPKPIRSSIARLNQLVRA